LLKLTIFWNVLRSSEQRLLSNIDIHQYKLPEWTNSKHDYDVL